MQRRAMVAFVALGVIWGSNFIFMKWATRPSHRRRSLGSAGCSFMAAAVFLRSERVTALRLLGVLVGFAGVLLIARPWERPGRWTPA